MLEAREMREPREMPDGREVPEPREMLDSREMLNTPEVLAARQMPDAPPPMPEGGQMAARDLPVASRPDVVNERVRVAGKFLYRGGEKFWIKGVTYGTFRPEAGGAEYHDRRRVERDFADIAAAGLNAVRTYTVPPRWLLDLAQDHGLVVLVGVPWEQHVAFLDDPMRALSIEVRVREGVRSCRGHPAVLCYAIGNEIPAPIVRWYGRQAVERYVERLYRAAKAEDPDTLVTYVNYPSTEYLDLSFLDLVCFNVYLESADRLDAYLARLQNIAGERPLVMGELGLCSRHHGEAGQARGLDWQLRTAFGAGCAGAFIFAWTDEWHRGGYDVMDWDFGLTGRDRKPKAALATVREAIAEVPFAKDRPWPRISVVVCSYNGARTIRHCCEGLVALRYPDFEVIVVDDGSTDNTAAIAREFGFRVISQPNRGLSNARNTGLAAATGEIVAYIDDDASPDPDWLSYLAATFMSTDHAGVGGPNIAPPGDGWIADCVANAPGGPIHVLLGDRLAEHIPGCNMAFRKSCLDAIGGFDSRYRAAGDDVDVCWRLQERGWTLGFSAAAMVWHHRRNSARAYWRQQVGYGKAEALLEAKWPQKYNAAGHVAWGGRLYGKGLARALGWRRGRIYQGSWGTAMFQSLYERTPGPLSSLPLMPEWYLLIACLAMLSLLGVVWRPLLGTLPLLAVAMGAPLVQAALSAAKASFRTTPGSDWERVSLYAMTAGLHLLQPLARLHGRLRHGLTLWRRRGAPFLAAPVPRTATLWSESWQDPSDRLRLIEAALRADGAPTVRGGDYDGWDLEVQAGLLGGARTVMTTEEHGGGRQLVRFYFWPRCSPGALGIILLLMALTAWAASDHAWAALIALGPGTLMVALRTLQESATGMAALLLAQRSLSEASQASRRIEASERAPALPERALSAGDEGVDAQAA
jgi:O-antigen biosynthesis protein